jgi:hypothetical protein
MADGDTETDGFSDGETDGISLGCMEIDGDPDGIRLMLSANESVGLMEGKADGAKLGKLADNL